MQRSWSVLTEFDEPFEITDAFLMGLEKGDQPIEALKSIGELIRCGNLIADFGRSKYGKSFFFQPRYLVRSHKEVFSKKL